MYEMHPQLKEELPFLVNESSDDPVVIETNGNNNEAEGMDPRSLTKQVGT